MKSVAIQQELARFNSLTSDEAKKILAAAEGQQADFRSCWYCNGAHERLKDRELLRCFGCGVLYVKGYPVIVAMERAEGKVLREEDLAEYWKEWD